MDVFTRDSFNIEFENGFKQELSINSDGDWEADGKDTGVKALGFRFIGSCTTDELPVVGEHLGDYWYLSDHDMYVAWGTGGNYYKIGGATLEGAEELLAQLETKTSELPEDLILSDGTLRLVKADGSSMGNGVELSVNGEDIEAGEAFGAILSDPTKAIEFIGDYVFVRPYELYTNTNFVNFAGGIYKATDDGKSGIYRINPYSSGLFNFGFADAEHNAFAEDAGITIGDSETVLQTPYYYNVNSSYAFLIIPNYTGNFYDWACDHVIKLGMRKRDVNITERDPSDFFNSLRKAYKQGYYFFECSDFSAFEGYAYSTFGLPANGTYKSNCTRNSIKYKGGRLYVYIYGSDGKLLNTGDEIVDALINDYHFKFYYIEEA